MNYKEIIRKGYDEEELDRFTLADLPMLISLVEVFCEDNNISLKLSICNSLKKETLISYEYDKGQVENAD